MTIGATADCEILPLSPMQRGMLFHTLSAPCSGINIEQLTGMLREEIDPAVFARAWQRLVDRHDALRTSFRLDDPPAQLVHAHAELPFKIEDWREFDAAKQAADRAEWLREDRARDFTLAPAPLMRITLFQLAATHWEFVWTFHHALLDGRSLPPLIRELFTIYEALFAGAGPTLPEPQTPHTFHAWLAAHDFGKSRLFWQELLAGFDTPVSLASTRPLAPREPRRHPACEKWSPRASRSSSDSDTADDTETLETRWPLAEPLAHFARENGVTANTVAQAAWALLLARYTRSDDVVFGTIRAGRAGSVAGAETMIALAINTIPVRVRVSEKTALLPWLRELREQHLAVRPHEQTPLVEIQKASAVPAGAALFDTLFAFENYGLDEQLRAPGGAWSQRHFELLEKTNFPLTLNVYAGRELHVKVAFARARFTAPQIARMLGHFETLLRAMLANPHATLAELPMLTAPERTQLLTKWNQATQTFPPSRSIHELFEAQADRAPDAIAVTFEQTQFTYAEIESRANQLAHHLRARGAGPETLIALSLERSLDLVIAILGILKSGAAYVPCDPEIPAERLAFILADSRAPILVTHSSLLARLSSPAAEVICLDRDRAAIASQPASRLDPRAAPENVAYVIYTSGSTGKPKGCCVTHHNVVRLFESTDDWFHFGPADVWTLFHSFAFDFSVWEIWGALAFGGHLVVVPHAITRSPENFLELLAREKVTVLNQTPSAFRQLIAAEESTNQQPLLTAHCSLLPSLRLVIFGGEALDLPSLAPWFGRHGDRQPQLVNMYGITETTVHVTYRPLTAADLAAPGSIIGRAIPDLDLYILDPAGEPCPIGIPGELHVGGAGLARGYLNRPELTAERFIENPFRHSALDTRHSPRLYRTGDLARYLPDGDIEYLGRIDQQVKIRGFRIELGEIESALAAHPAVRHAHVLAHDDSASGTRLAAYIVPRGEPLEISALREHLRRTLPDYMVPAAFVFLDAMPLTANGKLDRRALPAPEPARPSLAAEFAEPRSAAERRLAEIWRKVLRLERVGIHDNFYELGGDSILGILIIAQARKAGLALTPKQLFEHQTIAGLATAAPADAAATEPKHITGEAPLTPIQHWFFEHNFAPANRAREGESALRGAHASRVLVEPSRLDELPEAHRRGRVRATDCAPPETAFARDAETSPQDALAPRSAAAHHWNQAFIFNSTEPLDPAAIAAAVDAVAQNHPAFRLRFSSENHGWNQYHADSAGHDLCRRLSDAEDFGVAVAQAHASLDCTTGPTLRAVLAADATRLFVVAHHLCIDGVSWRVLLEDLETAYRQLRHGSPVHLAPPTTSFQHWSEQLTAAAKSPALAAELPHWKSLAPILEGGAPATPQLPAPRPTSPLPRDRAGGENTEASAHTITAALTPAETDTLLQRLPAATQTRINDALLTALTQTLAEWTGSTSHLIELEGHGREESLVAELLGSDKTPADLSRTIGWFTTIFPVRLDLDVSRKDAEPQSSHTQPNPTSALLSPSAPPRLKNSLLSIRDQLRAIPRRGLGYSLLRHLAGHDELRTRAEVLFNYLGQFEHSFGTAALFRLSAESAGAWHSPRAHRTHLLEVNCLVIGGRLEARWIFSENLHDAATIKRVAKGFIDALRTLIAGCAEPASPLEGTAPSVPIEESHALSPMQQLFYALEAAQPNAGFDEWHFTLRGPLDLERFRRAWREAFARHSALRTSFVSENGSAPRQIVSRKIEPPLHIEDWRGIAPAAQHECFAEFLRADRALGFDLARAPLTRLALLRLRDDEWRFIWSHHHLQIDGWSWPLLFREISALYDGATLPPARRYGDFIAWHQARSLAADELFWREKLRGFTQPTPLPEKSAGNGTDAVHESALSLSPDKTAALADLARATRVTLNVLVQAAWALLLSRSSGTRDIVFGASFSGRPAELEGVENIVGHFVNNVPVRIAIEPAEPLADLFRRLQKELVTIDEHQFAPLAQIQEWSGLPWHARLFESLLVFQNYVVGEDALRLGTEVAIEDAFTPVRTAYPLTIVAEQGAELRLTVIAAARHFTAPAADSVRDQLAALLHAFAENRTATCGELQQLLPALRAATQTPAARASHDFTPPQTATERALAAIWQEAFSRERIGIRDNFFDLGGHSLLMIRVHARLREMRGGDISIVRMFQHPTIQSLARHLDGGASSALALAAAAQSRAERQRAALPRQRSVLSKA